MKIRLICLTFAGLLLLTSFFSGEIVLRRIPTVKIAHPDRTEYTRSVNCTGEIVERCRHDTYFSLPLMVSEVNVRVGDHVKKGEVLATVDQSATAASLISSYASASTEELYALIQNSQIPQDAVNVFSASGSLSDHLKEIPSEIRAEISGTVTSLNLSVGTPTKAYTPVLTIIDDDSLVAKVAVSENNIEYIHLGDRATITGNAFHNRSYDAVVSAIYPSAYKKYNSLSYETVVDVVLSPTGNTDALKAGYTAKASIYINDKQTAITAPYEAVRQDDLGEYVYVMEKGRAEKKYVTTGLELSRGFEILSGISRSDWLICNPDVLTQSGMTVRVKTDEN